MKFCTLIQTNCVDRHSSGFLGCQFCLLFVSWIFFLSFRIWSWISTRPQPCTAMEHSTVSNTALHYSHCTWSLMNIFCSGRSHHLNLGCTSTSASTDAICWLHWYIFFISVITICFFLFSYSISQKFLMVKCISKVFNKWWIGTKKK